MLKDGIQIGTATAVIETVPTRGLGTPTYIVATATEYGAIQTETKGRMIILPKSLRMVLKVPGIHPHNNLSRVNSASSK